MSDFSKLDEIKREFDFDNLLTTDGFHFDPKNSKQNSIRPGGYEYKIFHLLGGAHNRPVVTLMRGFGPAPGNHKLYKNLNDDSDSGSIIDYLKEYHHLEHKELYSYLFGHNPKHFISKPAVYHEPKLENPIDPYVVLSSTPVHFDLYLKERQLYKALKLPQFDGFVHHVRYRKGDKERQTLGFPIFDKEHKIPCYSLKNDFLKGTLTGSRRGGLWHSKFLAGSKLFFSESAIDCLAHALSHPNEPPFTYLSTQGRYSQQYIETLKIWYPDLGKQRLLIGFDNDLDGAHYTLSLLKDLFELPYGVGKKKGEEKKLDRVHVTFKSSLDFKIFSQAGEKHVESNKIVLDCLQCQNLVEKFVKYYKLDNVEQRIPLTKDWDEDYIAQLSKKRKVQM